MSDAEHDLPPVRGGYLARSVGGLFRAPALRNTTTTPAVDVRHLCRAYAALPAGSAGSRRAREIAARVFHATGYPLTSMAATDAKVVFDKDGNFIENAPLPRLPEFARPATPERAAAEREAEPHEISYGCCTWASGRLLATLRQERRKLGDCGAAPMGMPLPPDMAVDAERPSLKRDDLEEQRAVAAGAAATATANNGAYELQGAVAAINTTLQHVQAAGVIEAPMSGSERSLRQRKRWRQQQQQQQRRRQAQCYGGTEWRRKQD
ncbi:hypothetical protein JKP88DRAFT_244550 [Tribonema minus]|uniref:Uncharacterized protein n=1 Tax=Tribonema minus TaxID=303371 RepID=A0A836CFU7_9STRA|nr:hypothetical protein JKP88DRAFT_244550 [Tribonema minus]